MNTFLELTDENVINGDYCIRQKRISPSQYWLSIRYDYAPESGDKTATLSANVKTIGITSAVIRINSTETIIPTDSDGKFTVSVPINDDTPLQLFIGFSGSYSGELYVDDISLSIQ